MKKIISIFLIFSILLLSNGSFAYSEPQLLASSKLDTSLLANQKISSTALLQINSEIDALEKYSVDVSNIRDINITPDRNEYILDYDGVKENVCIEINNSATTITADNHNKSNTIIFKANGDVYLDGNKVEITHQPSVDRNASVIMSGVVWKREKSLKPYGSLTSSDYDNYLASGTQNIALGEALDALTVTALSTLIGLTHPYVGIAVSIAGVAKAVYDVIIAIDPKTENLGCAYTTYTAGASDYKYINKFYSNKECTGEYDLEVSYEHFIVY